MSKIICDVCGTSYPETATQCPICGCVRPGNMNVVASSDQENLQGNGNYTYVKGGRFSKSNVKKRNQGKVYAPEDTLDYDTQGGGSNVGLIIAVVLLFIAIAAVVTFIVIRLMGQKPAEQVSGSQIQVTTSATVASSETEATEATELVIRCEEITLSKDSIVFDKEGSKLLLNVTVSPKETTDPVIFTSSDSLVATVSDTGLISAEGFGEAVITVTCGEIEKQCTVTCTFGGEQEETEPTIPEEDIIFTFNREDFSMSEKKQTWKLYEGNVPVDQITWSSDNEKVATFKKGIVTATGMGMTTVRAKYGDKELTCIVRCNESVGPYTEPVEDEEELDYRISHTDVTLILNNPNDNSFMLTLRDKEGNIVNVTWLVDGEGVCSVAGNTVKALKSGIATVYVIYEDVKYACTVRVS